MSNDIFLRNLSMNGVFFKSLIFIHNDTPSTNHNQSWIQ